MDKIEYEGKDERKIEFIIYVLNDETVRTEIKTESVEYALDIDKSNGNTISLKKTIYTDEGSDIILYQLGKVRSDNK